MSLEEIILQKAKVEAALAYFLHNRDADENRGRDHWAGYSYAKMVLDQQSKALWQQWDQWSDMYQNAFVQEWNRLASNDIHIAIEDT